MGRLFIVLCGLGVLGGSVFVHAQMPDPKQMAGIPRPATDLPNSAVSVRLIRGAMTNNIANHPVELHFGGEVRTVNTDADGRAEFTGVPPGTTVQAVAVVDGERLESQEFPIPAGTGIRLLLVATDKEIERKQAEAAVPAVPGEVVIGGESRIVIEHSEEHIEVYYLLDISNPSTSPVNPPTPFVLEMPSDAIGTTVLQGSSPLASAEGRKVTVAGPFAPGRTFVQIGTQLPINGGTMEIAQTFPAQLDHLALIATKVGDMRLTSPQIDRQQDMPADGRMYIAAAGGALAAGQPLTLTLTGLPHHSAVPSRVALVLAVGIALIGVWVALRPEDPTQRDAERKKLIAKRERLFQDLVRLENERRRGRIDDGRYASRREELLASLELVYGALDSDDTTPEPADRSPLTRSLDQLRAS
jgi:hypothetical protein